MYDKGCMFIVRDVLYRFYVMTVQKLLIPIMTDVYV